MKNVQLPFYEEFLYHFSRGIVTSEASRAYLVFKVFNYECCFRLFSTVHYLSLVNAWQVSTSDQVSTTTFNFEINLINKSKQNIIICPSKVACLSRSLLRYDAIGKVNKPK